MRARIGATAVAAMMVFASAAANARATAEDVVDRETLKSLRADSESTPRRNHRPKRDRKTARDVTRRRRLEVRGDVPDDPFQERRLLHSRNGPGSREQEPGRCRRRQRPEGGGEAPRGRCRRRGLRRVRRRRAPDRLRGRVHLRNDRADACCGRRVFTGPVPCPDHDHRAAATRRHGIGSGRQGHADHLRRRGGEGVPGRGEVGRLLRPRGHQERVARGRRALEGRVRLRLDREQRGNRGLPRRTAPPRRQTGAGSPSWT